MLTKQKILYNFSKASGSYENFATIQKQSAEFLVKKFLDINHNFLPHTILDLGTGTGYAVEFLLKHYPNASYLLNDIAEKMLEICKLKFANNKNIMSCNVDMELLDFIHYDLIISNLALQWTCDLLKCIEKFCSKSNVFCFSTLLKGTFDEWQNIVKQYINIAVIKDYPDESQLVNYCSGIRGVSNFYFWKKDFPMEFKNCLDFIKYLKGIGANLGTHNLPIDALRKIISNQQNPLKVTYKVFFGIFHQEVK